MLIRSRVLFPGNTLRLLKVFGTVRMQCTIVPKNIGSDIFNNINTFNVRKNIPMEYRFIYPEFLPDPNPTHRNALREKLERIDMLKRRSVIKIPEFYVGSIIAVTHSEPHAILKSNRFLGICIQRTGTGLRASFILRNVIDGQGVEMLYNLYDPTIKKIECIKLEKRLDNELLYLRDCPLEYSTFPLDMEMIMRPAGAPVPINDIKVPPNPKPWLVKWERENVKGLIINYLQLSSKRRVRLRETTNTWEKYDLMKIYRETIPEEEQKEIFSDVYQMANSIASPKRKTQK